MAGPRKPPAPSRPPSTAPLPRGSSLANSTAATAPPRSPPPCCARSITPFRLKSGSAHHLVGYFPRPDIFPSGAAHKPQRRTENIGLFYRWDISHLPSHL